MEILQGFLHTLSLNSSSVIVRGNLLFLVSEQKIRSSRKNFPDRTHMRGNMLDAVQDHPVFVAKMILLCFPISSMIRIFLHGSAISFKCSSSNSPARSRPGCRISAILALQICFRRNMQKFGAVRGLGLFFSIK